MDADLLVFGMLALIALCAIGIVRGA